MTEVLTSEPALSYEQLEDERYDFISKNLAEAAILLALNLKDSAPKPYNIGIDHLPADVYND